MKRTFVRSDQDIKLERSLARFFVENHMIFHDGTSLILLASHSNGTDARAPFGEFSTPVADDRFGDNDKVRASNTTAFTQVGKE